MLVVRDLGPRMTGPRCPGGLESTHCCLWTISRRATGRPWNLTFALAADKASGGDSGRSRVASIIRQEILVERLHPKAANLPFRPKPGMRQPRLTAPKRSLADLTGKPLHHGPPPAPESDYRGGISLHVAVRVPGLTRALPLSSALGFIGLAGTLRSNSSRV